MGSAFFLWGGGGEGGRFGGPALRVRGLGILPPRFGV